MAILTFINRRIDRLTHLQQCTLVIVFVGAVINIMYINVFCRDSDTFINLQFKPERASFVWNASNLVPPHHPSLAVIGSVNGGTSLLNELFAFFLHSFHHDSRRKDTFYWMRCMPCDQISNQSTNFLDWKLSATNLCSVSYQNRTVHPASNLMDVSQTHRKCTTQHYLSLIMKDYPSALQEHEWRFSGERCSGYIQVPHVAKTFAIMFPHTVLVYAIREKATQSYSRAKNFYHGAGEPNAHHFNQAFQLHLQQIEETSVSRGLMPLLNQSKQTEQIRDEIVKWYLAYSSNLRELKLPFQNDFRDLCPYINVLVYMKILNMFNAKYSFTKLKLVQSEWIYQDILRTARYLHCIVSISDASSEQELQECNQYYVRHLTEILSFQDIITLSDNTYAKNRKYKYLLSDYDTLRRLNAFWEICDTRLFHLIDEFPTLTTGNHWNATLWSLQRREIVRIVSENVL